MSDQYPAYPPAPNQMPTAQPNDVPAAPDAPPQEQPPAGGGRKTTLIVISIVVGVLLVCGCSLTAGVLAFSAIDTDFEVNTSVGGTPEDTGAAARLEEWRAWTPATTDERLDAAPSAKSELISESLRIVAPDFTSDEVFMIDGYYDEAEEWYYSDYVVMTAKHPTSDQTLAGIEFSIQSDQMIEKGIPFEPDEGDVVTTIADGAYELLYYPQWVDGVDETLWRQIGEEWPGAVVMDVYESEDLPGAMIAEITNRDAYVIYGSSPRVYVTYESLDGGWRLYEWQYWYPSEEPIDESAPSGAPPRDQDAT